MTISMVYKLLGVLSFVFTVFIVQAQHKTNPQDQPEELGQVSWYRSYDQALKASEEEDKPVFILFQEVPGCATCRNYGANVLSHPLIIDAIENEFIPLTIFNNKGGEDKKILKKYNEPTWNNPVARIVDKNGKDIVARLNRGYSPSAVVSYLESGLKYSNRKVPEYLKLLNLELNANSNNTDAVYYKMYCFWSGEASLGKLDGVVETSPGFMNGGEVVKVVFDKDIISEKEISQLARANDMQLVRKPGRFRMDGDPQYYLKKSDYKYLPLTVSQRSKVNSAIANRTQPDVYLSPFQIELKQKMSSGELKKKKSLYEMEFLQAAKAF